MKTIFKHFLATALLLLISTSMNAEVYSGVCGADGDNVKWSLDTDTGILTIYGNGMMNNFKRSSPPRAPWYEYRFNIYTIEINGKISNIGDYSFDGCNKLTSINIPESVTSIGDGAFYRCSGLTSITIPEGVTSIGSSAFYGCSVLTSINIPDGVTSIGYSAFEGCSSLPIENNLRYADTYLVEAVDKTLSTYNIKVGTRFVGESAFSDCSNLTSITIPKSVTSIGAWAFKSCI